MKVLTESGWKDVEESAATVKSDTKNDAYKKLMRQKAKARVKAALRSKLPTKQVAEEAEQLDEVFGRNYSHQEQLDAAARQAARHAVKRGWDAKVASQHIFHKVHEKNHQVHDRYANLQKHTGLATVAGNIALANPVGVGIGAVNYALGKSMSSTPDEAYDAHKDEVHAAHRHGVAHYQDKMTR